MKTKSDGMVLNTV